MRYPMMKLGLMGAVSAAFTLFASSALADKPVDWQIWHQTAASPGMEAIVAFDWWTLYFVVPITLFVMFLLGYVMFRFRASANPVPSKTTHNTAIEVVWTLAPVLILIAISVPSFQLLSKQFNPPEPPAFTIKATGYQWYWGYEYQDTASEVSFEARPIGSTVVAGTVEAAAKEREDLGKTDLDKYPNLLAVDNEIVVPVGKVIRVLVTAGDVIHDFAMPAFGLKMDGIPGRINETYFQPSREGLYYGQCSELCGKLHAYMPIAIRVVSQAQFDTWLAGAANDVGAANKALMAAVDNNKKVALNAPKASDGQ